MWTGGEAARPHSALRGGNIVPFGPQVHNGSLTGRIPHQNGTSWAIEAARLELLFVVQRIWHLKE